MTSQHTDDKNSSGTPINLRLLMRTQFDEARLWWRIALWSRLTIVFFSILSPLAPWLASVFAVSAFLLVVGQGVAQWRSDRRKSNAEAILRKLEMYDGIGWPITPEEKLDLVMQAPKSIREKVLTGGPPKDNYFDSNEEQSPR